MGRAGIDPSRYYKDLVQGQTILVSLTVWLIGLRPLTVQLPSWNADSSLWAL